MAHQSFDIECEREFARTVKEVRKRMAEQRSATYIWMQMAERARSRASRLTSPYSMRRRSALLKDAEKYALLADRRDRETRPEIIDDVISKYIVELALLRERTHNKPSQRSVMRKRHTLAHAFPSVLRPATSTLAGTIAAKTDGNGGDASAASGARGVIGSGSLITPDAAMAREHLLSNTGKVENTVLTASAVVQRMRVRFGLDAAKVFVRMDEVCDECGVCKEILPDIAMLWCPACLRTWSHADMGVQSVDLTRRKHKDARADTLKKMLNCVKNAQAQEPTSVDDSVVRDVARCLISKGFKDPSKVTFADTCSVIRNDMREMKVNETRARFAREQASKSKSSDGVEVHSGGLGGGGGGGGDELETRPPPPSTGGNAYRRRRGTALDIAIDDVKRKLRNLCCHAPQIHCKVTHQPPLRLTDVEMHMIIVLFVLICDKYTLVQGSRTVFLAYNRVIYRECEILGIERALPYFASSKEDPSTDEVISKIFRMIGLPDTTDRSPSGRRALAAFYLDAGVPCPSHLRSADNAP